MLPNLIVIGAAKCGTTSLHRYLDLHPEIAMSRTKELKFFIREAAPGDVRWYESQFRDAPVRGESSPAYAQNQTYPGTAERMARLVPDAKLLYVVRDPIDRFVSHHRYTRHAVRDIDVEPGEFEPHLDASRYGFQFGAYLERFPREQMLVLDHSELDLRRAETLAAVFRFLAVDDSFTSPAFEVRHNVTDGDRRPNVVGRAMIGASRRMLGDRRTATLRARTPHAAVPFLLSRPEIPRVDLDPGLRARLEEELRPDAARFRELAGMAFTHWSV